MNWVKRRVARSERLCPCCYISGLKAILHTLYRSLILDMLSVMLLCFVEVFNECWPLIGPSLAGVLAVIRLR
ncbi:hypothetical protein GJAV_G00263760 [Gymnothorax javanicus]|nr:hypothetical protein GJAV_G00263760 [Gymnothorax javanicus]